MTQYEIKLPSIVHNIFLTKKYKNANHQEKKQQPQKYVFMYGTLIFVEQFCTIFYWFCYCFIYLFINFCDFKICNFYVYFYVFYFHRNQLMHCNEVIEYNVFYKTFLIVFIV